MTLREQSIEVILEGQAPSGAFVASPDFAPYRYCWLRDGTFCAYALDLCGEHDAAEQFYRWVGKVIAAMGSRVTRLVARAQMGDAISPSELLPARYNIDGTAVGDDWPNFQLDGYGTWMWGLSQHALLAGRAGVWEELADAVDITCTYLEAFALRPCFDCWEEAGDSVHTSTLACVYGGLAAAGEAVSRPAAKEAAAKVRQVVLDEGVRGGRLTKSVGSSEIDASLLWVGVPFGVIPPDDPAMKATESAIQEGLLAAGGVRRYEADTYYGGGAWPLLTAWLGWHHARVGAMSEAERCLRRIEALAGTDGSLPEQVGGERRDPAAAAMWMKRWGPPARRLLWSHAMYLALADAIECRGR